MIKFIFWICLFAILYTYFGYYIILMLLAGLKAKNRKLDEEHIPFVSIVVSAHNEDKVLPGKIENFKNLDYPKNRIEFLIGSDSSTDGTNDILNNARNSFIRFYPFQVRRGKAAVLNDLLNQVKGDIVVFSDANTIYKPDAIKRLVRHFVEPAVGGVCGRLHLESQHENIGGKGEKLYWDYENHIKKIESCIRTVFGANGAIYAIRKQLYKPLPTDIVIMDDFLIAMRIVEMGYDVVFEEQAVGYEAAALSEKGEFVRKVRIGAANFNSLQYIKPLLNPKRGFVSFGLWSHKIFRWFAPFLMIMLILSNLALAESSFYTILLIIQGLFYVIALIGWIISLSSRKVILFSYFYYFFLMNLGLLIGFFKFVLGTQKPAWSRTDR